MAYTRRDVGRLAFATLPAAAGLTLPRFAFAAPNSKIKNVQIGAITYSFRQGVPKAEIIPDMVKIGLSEVELMSGDAEALAGAPVPAPAAGGGRGRGAGGGRGRAPLTPEQIAARDAQQKAMKDWRAGANPAVWEGVRKKFSDAGINLAILCYNMNVNTADDEIEYAFAMAKALKVKAISCSTTVAVAKRVAPFADKHKIMWAGHGHDNTADPEQFAKPETFDLITSFSKYIGINLDIGHFTAANYDPIPFIQQHHARITNLHLKDRKKDHGPNVPWGTGDTPIKEVLLLMSKEKYNFPANIEFEYSIPEGSDPVTEVSKCYQYVRSCLEA
jgi:sugar phosphate isomerase/epimerase